MNRRSKLLLSLGFAALLASPAFSDDGAPPPAGGAPPSSPTPSAEAGAKSAAASAKYDTIIRFDKDSAAGAIVCKGGREEGGKVEFAQCRKGKMDKYDDVAVKKGIVASKEAFVALTKKDQEAAKALAFYGSARNEVKAELAEAAAAKAEGGTRYKSLRGAYRQIDRQYKRALRACGRAGQAIKCPPEPTQPAEPGMGDPGTPSNPVP